MKAQNEDYQILIVDDEQVVTQFVKHALSPYFNVAQTRSGKEAIEWLKDNPLPKVIISDLHMPEIDGLLMLDVLKSNPLWKEIPVLLLSGSELSKDRIACLEKGASDYLSKPFHPEELLLRVRKLAAMTNDEIVQKKKALQKLLDEDYLSDLSFSERVGLFCKRALDISVSFSLLLILSPFMFLIMLAIRLESKGKVFYASKRVGRGYEIFDFYKFRSMYADADQRLAAMKHLNQYSEEKKVVATTADGFSEVVQCSVCGSENGVCESKVWGEGGERCEAEYIKELHQGAAFMKIANDPRITKVGKFIRSTSLDELPQLVNVLKGDMSLVGNRPLPLYEAEKLTTDDAIERFQGPAGITGLWQVTKRGKKDMSEQERKELDNNYARSWSFWKDIKILLMTIPALLQKEDV
ncbi:sugar transferase [Algivirga pacifica]|uniref:Response regulatory domain-containing protein n=1 Tax=Algivirga pacifica TaxID=1162670 RepID=A0ABP9DEF5_9BACT